MKRFPDNTVLFRPSRQVLYNPYMGFTTFQHFRGDPLFSNSVEGWKKEFYPLYAGVEQKGDTEGFHPDATLAYIRISWRDFEPEEGVYNTSLVEDLLNLAEQHNQSLILRLMPHTTRWEQDIPDWLACRIPHPERPEDARVKESPTDPLFFSCFSRAVQKLGERFDGHPLLYAVDISLSGAWGEGHNVDFMPQEHIIRLVDAYTHSFSLTPLIGQICSPELIHYARKTRPMGFRGDCLGNMDYHMTRSYPKAIAQMPDVWKDSPIAFEVCWTMDHWDKMGWDIDYIIEQSLKWHISSFNAKSSPCPYKWKKEVDYWLTHMGYRFAIRSVDYPSHAKPGDQLELCMWLENRGVAPIYRALPFRLRLRGENCHYILDTGLDIRRWMPGDTVETFTVSLPQEIPAGNYLLEAGIGDDTPSCPTVQLAMEGENDGHYWTLAKIEIER